MSILKKYQFDPTFSIGGPMIHRIFFYLLTFCISATSTAQTPEKDNQEYRTVENVLYRTGENLSAYAKQMCRLDVYYPMAEKDFATVVWFHGGGLKGGQREVPVGLKAKGIAVVAVDYRLSPNAKSPDWLEDAAAAVAWTTANIQRYGGSNKKIFVSGHSAGGYLTSMVGLDKRWLAAHEVDANSIAGLIPLSGQAITHFTTRAERGIPQTKPTIDEMAPLYHVRNDASPMLLVTGDRDLEMLGRYEENAYLWRMMLVVGHKDTALHELDGFNHGQMVDPAIPMLLRFIQSISDQIEQRSERPR